MNLIKNVKIRSALNAASSLGASTGPAIDMSGFEGCLFILHGTSVLEGTTANLRTKGAASTTGPWVFYEPQASSTKVLTGTFDYRILALDMHKPLKRYIRACLTASSSGVPLTGTVTALQYGAQYPESTNLYDSTTVAAITLAVGATSS